MTFHVDSEVGQLKQVIVHRPGLELTRLTPEQRRRAAVRRRDVGRPGPRGARRVRRPAPRHAAWSSTTSRRCSPRRSTSRAPGSSSRSGSPRPPGSDRPWTRRSTSWSARHPQRLLAELLIGGVLKRDVASLLHDTEPADGLPAPPTTSCCGRCRTTCSSATTRPGSTTGCRSTRWPSRPASGRRSTPASSTTSTRCSATPASTFLYGNDSLAHEPATVEGGDITVIGNGAVMIGMGERTTPQGVEILARSLFAGRYGRHGDRRRAAAGARVHAPGHGR